MTDPQTPIAVVRPPASTPVHITDFDMPFGSMVGLMIKRTLAAIPALILLGLAMLVMYGVLFGLFALRDTLL